MYYSGQPLSRVPAQVQGAQMQKHTINVFGEATIAVPPDQVTILLGVKKEDKEVSEAQQENAQAINQIIETLERLGIPRQSIQTASYQISPQYDYVDGEQKFRAYTVTHLLQVQTKELSSAGTIVDQAVSAGANEVVSINFTIEQSEEISKEALVQALQNAAGKAVALANALSVPLNPVPVKIQEQRPQGAIVYQQPMFLSTSDHSTPLEPGLITIRAIVEVWYEVG